jgi:gliding motility-associated-like protein
MEGKDHIKELFKNQLDGFEADVRPDLWNAISSQLPVSAPIPSTGLSWLTKSLLIAASAAVVGVTVYVLTPGESKKQESKTETPLESDRPQEVVQQNQVNTTASTEKPIQASSVITENSDLMEDQISSIEELSVPVLQQLSTSLNSTGVKELLTEKLETTAVNTEETNNTKTQEKTEVPVQRNIDVDQTNEPTEKHYTLVDPVNIFTPNSDGVNDIFELPSSGLDAFSIVVLDGRNKAVFTSTDPDFKWGGTLSGGEPLPTGNYIYYLTARDKNGNPVTQSSYLRIVR